MQANDDNAQRDAKKTEALNVARLISAGRAGWANDPRGTGSVLVERATGCVFLSSDGEPIARSQKVEFQSANRIDMGKFRNHVGLFEGVVQHMYLDVEGNVTVGIGHLLKDVAAAEELPFHDRETGVSSHSVQIENAFNLVLRNQDKAKGGASVFKDITHIDLGFNAIESLFDKDITGFKGLLKSGNPFPDFMTYPAGAQLGMLDMAYTMGVAGFYRGFPILTEALKSRNWLKVADESGRRVISDRHGNPGLMADRNKIVHGWFLEAFKDEPFSLNRNCSPKQLPMKPV